MKINWGSVAFWVIITVSVVFFLLAVTGKIHPSK